MTAPRIGSLFSGYGGLDLAVESVTGAITAWHCEYEAAPSKILAHHWPGVPNLGDITAVDWDAVEPVDIITGGSPCQDLSHAGRRAGMTDGTRSNLWVQMREAIATLRPSMVVWENVRGAYSAGADSDVEPCAGCVGDGSGVHLRALGRVLGDLADLGYDAQWHGLRAADIGAPHGRFRVFVAAWDAESHHIRNAPESRNDRTWRNEGSAGATGRAVADPKPEHVRPRRVATRAAGGPHLELAGRGGTLAPHPSGDGRQQGWPESAGLVGGSDAAQRGPVVADASGGGRERRRTDGIRGSRTAVTGSGGVAWGQYAAAIQRWEHAIGRPAPAPTEPGPKGGQRLSARLVEWMMGLPEGWVTDVPGISRNDQLKALGNGVVPQQAAAALRHMLGDVLAVAS